MRAALIARGPRAAPTQRARPAARPPAKCSPPSSCPLARPFPARRVLLPPASHSFSSAPLSFASTVCMASSFLLLALPASPRACAHTHLIHASSASPPTPPLPFARPVPLPLLSFSPTPALPATAIPFLPLTRRARMEPLPLPALCFSTPSPLRSLALARLDPSSPRCSAVSHPSMSFLCLPAEMFCPSGPRAPPSAVLDSIPPLLPPNLLCPAPHTIC